MTIAIAAVTGLLFGSGVYLLLRRSAVRMLFGLVLLTHAANLLVFASGGIVRGEPPVVQPDTGRLAEGAADPLPQALVLTAIVIGFGLIVFAAVLVARVRRSVKTDDTDELREELR